MDLNGSDPDLLRGFVLTCISRGRGMPPKHRSRQLLIRQSFEFKVHSECKCRVLSLYQLAWFKLYGTEMSIEWSFTLYHIIGDLVVP